MMLGELLQFFGDLIGIFRKIIVTCLMRMYHRRGWSLWVRHIDCRVRTVGIIIIVVVVVMIVLSAAIVREDGERSLQETLRHHSTRVHYALITPLSSAMQVRLIRLASSLLSLLREKK